MDRKGTLGLIPAKGGSTRLARKNLRVLGGKSLLAWAVDAARASGVLDRLIVSSEDEGVLEEARRCGAETPFVRPAELARDPFGVVDVALHALEQCEAAGLRYRTLVILLPTCPFRTVADVTAGFRLFQEAEAKFLMSVSEYPHTPFAAMRLDPEGTLQPFFPEYIGKQSQELPQAYRCNGALHVLDVAAFQASRSYYSTPLIGYPMPRSRSVDIDTEEDLAEAEWRLAQGRHG